MRTSLIAALLVLGACSSNQIPATTAPAHSTRIELREGNMSLGGNSRTIATREQLSQSPREIWPALLSTYNEFGIAVAALDSTTFLIGNPELPVRQGRLAGELASRSVDCGRTATGNPIADRYSVTLQIHTQLIPTANGTEIRSVLTGRAVNPTTNDPPLRCTSTGRLEQRILESMTLRTITSSGT